MNSSQSRLPRVSNVVLLILAAWFSVWAQADPHPDSPTPILISEPDSTRALATSADKVFGRRFPETQFEAFSPNQKIVLYATNLQLLDGEEANAFRIAVKGAEGRDYRFPVLDIAPLAGREWVYALTIELKDTLNFHPVPEPDGDVLIALAWRGLASNRVRLGFGKTGGSIKDDAEARPTPFPSTPIKNFVNRDEPDAVGYLHSGDRKRFMEQATFGPTTALDERIRRIGLRVWLEEQFNAAYPTVPYPDVPLMQSNPPGDCNGTENPNTGDPPDIYPHCRRDRYTMYLAQNWFFKEAFYGEAQLRHRVAWALAQMWVVSGVDTQQSSHLVAYHKVLSANAFGNYRKLMKEMTLNPAMGNYLDMVRNTKQSVNENYAREILQLFTIGVFLLNQDGTVRLDSNNRPIPTYNQTTVNNFTKVFTGWGFCEVLASCPNRTQGAPNYKDPMLLVQDNHDTSAKTLLEYPNAVNKNIAPQLNGNAELELALDNIYNHPNVAPLVSHFLIQHLVISDPTPAYVGRVAATFNANRTNPSQMKEVVQAILLDPEARGNLKTATGYGKLREPVQLATNLMRHFGVRSADGATESDGYVAHLLAASGQNVFYSPTVFNYYPPDYVIPGPGINGPEFGIMTTSTAIARMNSVRTIVFSGVAPGANTTVGTSLNLEEMRMLAASDHSGNQLLDALNQKMLYGRMTAQNKATILTAIQTAPRTDPMLRARMAIYLIATSSKYQVQR